MSELQNDSVDSEVIEPVIENQEIETDLAPVSEAEHEPQPQVDEEAAKQEAINKAINKKHFEAKQAERERDEANAKLAEFERKQQEQLAQQYSTAPARPNFDDYFTAEEFNQDMQSYESKLREHERFNTQQSTFLQQQEAIQLQQQQAAQAEAMQLQNDFVSKSKAAGASDQEFNNIVNTLNNGGMTQQGAKAIMSLGEDGYFIAKHLAANVMEASEFNSLDPIQQGMKLVELKQKASALKPKTSNAPEPATNLQGNGVDAEAGKYRNIGGAKFE
jgi:hypothetical protein